MKNFFEQFKIPRFFKTKKVYIFAFIFVLFFLFTPISLHTIGNRMADLINDKAKKGVKAFEEQIGLKVEWEFLKVNLFIMTVELKGVKLTPLNNSNFHKIQELKFLDGFQKIKKISARPSLYSLIFKKQVVLSNLKIQEGDIYIKTLKTSFKGKTGAQDIVLPIKKIFVRNTSLNLKHYDHNLRFPKLRASIRQKKEGIFLFDLSAKDFYIDKDSGFKDFQFIKSYLSNKDDSNSKNTESVYSLDIRGQARKEKFSFYKINLSNDQFQSVTEQLEIYFDSQGVKSLKAKSSGSLPSSFIQSGMDLLRRKFVSFDSLLFYKLSIQYKRDRGYQGSFDIQGKESLFQSHSLQSFSLEGNLANHLLIVNRGLIETKQKGKIKIKKAEWIFKEAPSQFNFSVEVDKLSSDFVDPVILNVKNSPIKWDFTGAVNCRGSKNIAYLNCAIQGQSSEVKVQAKNKKPIVSLYGMNWDLSLERRNQILNFTVQGKKPDSSEIRMEGLYSQKQKRMEANYAFFGSLFTDLRFHTAFSIKGYGEVPSGSVIIEKDKIQLNGSFSSKLLEIQSYKLRNISGFYKLKNSQLDFFNVKGNPGRTNYNTEINFDFKKETVVLKLDSSFFDIEDLISAVKTNISLPISFKGTGDVSFSMKLPWSFPENRTFQVKGNLFNVSVNKEFFQQFTFNFGFQNKRGTVQSLSLRKRQGFVRGTGFFDSDYSLDLDISGENLSLEELEWLNESIPFNQSGDVRFNMKLVGQLNNPRITSDIFISNTLFYSYPVDDSFIKLNVNKKVLSFSGNIMNEIYIEKFIYPFSKNLGTKVVGKFSNLDFIKILFSKNRKDKKQDYFSKISGSFSFSKSRVTDKYWLGKALVDKLFIFRSNKWVKNEKPFSVFFNKNKWSLTPVHFSHHNGQKLNIAKSGKNKLLVSGESSLDFFSVLFPFSERFGGHIKGKILIDNNLRNPRPKGSLQIENGAFVLGILPDFTNVKSSLVFSENDIFVRSFSSSVGGGLIQGKGSVFYDFFNKPTVDLKFKFQNARLNIPKNFNTKGSGSIQISGKKIPYLISGEYLIDSGSITKDFSENEQNTKYNFSFLSREVEKKNSLFAMDLDIKTTGAVAVNSSLIQSSVEGQANIYGPLLSFLINGRFSLSHKAEENLIFFRGQEFKISSGSVIFRNSVPENPYLDIKADTVFKEQIVDPLEGQREIEREYKIVLSLKGLAKNYQLSLKSSPSLDEREIISLLTLGVGSRHFDANVKQNITDYSYQILASLLLEKLLNKEIKGALGLDFRQTPYIDTSNKPVTKITLSKNWFKKWRTSFSRTIEEQAQSDIRLRYDINQTVSLTTFWENTRQVELEDRQEDQLGIDFEFYFDF